MVPQCYILCLNVYGFEGVMWDLVVLIPAHCLSVYFMCRTSKNAASDFHRIML